jgi:putative hemolysin
MRYAASFSLIGLLLFAALGLAHGEGARAQTPEATPPGGAPTVTPAIDLQAAADYCVAQGGIVRERYPVWGTNGPASGQVRLGGARPFCEFTGGAGAEPPTSWISLTLETLYSDQPTLATLAYLTKPPLPQVTGGANPASVYCSHLGGSDQFGGTTGAGGGWVTDDTDTPIDVLQACAFPDGSIIDSWGITYHTNGTIRGADLTPILRYQSANPPNVFAG